MSPATELIDAPGSSASPTPDIPLASSDEAPIASAPEQVHVPGSPEPAQAGPSRLGINEGLGSTEGGSSGTLLGGRDASHPPEPEEDQSRNQDNVRKGLSVRPNLRRSRRVNFGIPPLRFRQL